LNSKCLAKLHFSLTTNYDQFDIVTNLSVNVRLRFK